MKEIKLIYASAVLSGILMIMLRMLVYRLLHDRRLLNKVGRPRLFFFSDTLPIRLIYFRDASIGNFERCVFGLYALIWLAFIISLVAMLILLIRSGF